MNTRIIYGGLFLISGIIATGLVVLVVPKPTHSEPRSSVRDSVSGVVDSVATDSSSAADQTNPDSTTATTDTTQGRLPDAAALRDSVTALRTRLELEQLKVASLNGHAGTPQRDTTAAMEKKKMAKLIDAMDAQGAARILHNLNDDEVKAILLVVKKRQAGKILSSLDPERAARIMR